MSRFYSLHWGFQHFQKEMIETAAGEKSPRRLSDSVEGSIGECPHVPPFASLGAMTSAHQGSYKFQQVQFRTFDKTFWSRRSRRSRKVHQASCWQQSPAHCRGRRQLRSTVYCGVLSTLVQLGWEESEENLVLFFSFIFLLVAGKTRTMMNMWLMFSGRSHGRIWRKRRKTKEDVETSYVIFYSRHTIARSGTRLIP